ncbi:MAG: hypothetical protein RLZZ214_1278 [Verrucomicrobiota bacterium]|jgi:hypothetical protein
MRFLILLLLALLFASCFPARPVPVSAPDTQTDPPPKHTFSESPPPIISRQASAPARATVLQIAGITFEGVSFDSRDHRLVVADQANGPGSQYADAASAARAHGGVAAVNAGFFTPEGAPLGLVGAAGKFSGAWNSASSLGSGAWYETPSGAMAIARREKLGRGGAAAMRELIQAGPLLVENGSDVRGLEGNKPSIRMMILWDGGTRWWIGRGTPCTLAELGRALAMGQPAGWPTRHALNLDGGRSSDLWISDSISSGPVLRRPPWNRPVRNFLVLVKR